MDINVQLKDSSQFTMFYVRRELKSDKLLIPIFYGGG